MTELQSFNNSVEYPSHLQSYSALVDHIDSLLDGQPPGEKGDRFARFITRLLPQTKWGAEFHTPELRPVKTHDKGIDLVARSRDGKSVIYIQAKKRVSSAQDIRDVLDGFNEFLTLEKQDEPELEQGSLFVSEDIPSGTTRHCMLVTLSRIGGIIDAYESRPSTTKPLYDSLVKQQLLHIIDGEEIFSILRSAFIKLSEVPYRLNISLAAAPCQKNGVYVGIIASDELKRLYSEFGEALFFENVRDFLGVDSSRQKGRTTPNMEILKTITESPQRLLERNNGIVMKAIDNQKKIRD